MDNLSNILRVCAKSKSIDTYALLLSVVQPKTDKDRSLLLLLESLHMGLFSLPFAFSAAAI